MTTARDCLRSHLLGQCMVSENVGLHVSMHCVPVLIPSRGRVVLPSSLKQTSICIQLFKRYLTFVFMSPHTPHTHTQKAKCNAPLQTHWNAYKGLPWPCQLRPSIGINAFFQHCPQTRVYVSQVGMVGHCLTARDSEHSSHQCALRATGRTPEFCAPMPRLQISKPKICESSQEEQPCIETFSFWGGGEVCSNFSNSLNHEIRTPQKTDLFFG